ncbi:hypothetical protein JA9_000949 [Meyerozyma sp. JA9]|nr:hypothetical protein JA9_000949 [Meyerozyma sp. JA9]
MGMFLTLNTLLDPVQQISDETGSTDHLAAADSVLSPAISSAASNRVSKPASSKSKPKSVSKPMHNNIILGSRYRSKTGCAGCRKRKKKCDEVHPTCGSCRHRGEPCEWGVVKPYKPVSPDSEETTPKILEISSKVAGNSEPKRTEILDAEIAKQTDVSRIVSTPKSPPFNSTPSDLLQLFSPSDFLDFEMPLLSSPSSTFSLYLDEAGLRLLNFYENKVAKILSVSPESSNYFLKTFFTAALSEESLMHALAAWGGVFSDGHDSSAVKFHLDKARQLIRTTYLNRPDLDTHGTYVAICYYLISMGIDICSGDVSNWYYLFNECTNLLKRRGGIVKFCRENQFSNDSKWLISNFQFHDVLSSATLKRGTSCDIEEYNRLFNNCFDMGSYGVDPYQGCIQPIFLLLGTIMNTNVELKEERDKINHEMVEASKKGLNLDNLAHRQLTLRRIRQCHEVEARYNKLLSDIHYCTPNQSQISHISHDKSEVDLHLTLFELYRLTCQIYLLLYIKQTQPSSSEVQLHFMNSLAYIESLMSSKLVPSLPMSLLICGMCCCNEYDRAQVRSIFDKLSATYTVGNVGRIWEIIQEAWKRNPHGDVCIDWTDICDEFGWKLSVC